MDGLKVCDEELVELMEYIGSYYNYKDWMRLVQYT